VPRIYWTDVVEDRRHPLAIIFYPPMGVVPGPTIGLDQSPDLTFSQRFGSGLFLYHQTKILFYNCPSVRLRAVIDHRECNYTSGENG
jgi:hypothetical protein